LNLYHYKARLYSPALGRFLQTDPIGYGDDLNLYAYVGNDPVNANDPSGGFVMQVGAGIVGGVGGLLFQAGTDLVTGKLSSVGDYAGAFVGGASGGVAAVTCGPACAGAVAGAASSVTQQVINNGSVNWGAVGLATGVGAVGGGVAGKVVPYLGKQFLSNGTKGAIGEALSEVGILATGGRIAQRNVPTGFGKSNLDFKLTNGTYVESKFGTSVPRGMQKTAINSGQFEGYFGEEVTHYWTYPRASGIAASPFVAAGK
jgi:hypothetical protein